MSHHKAAGQDQDHYTGVVIIHGLGDIKRNTTLEEAVNALAYWFNHKAGFALRREGPGRVWVTAQFTDDPNPDARAASASMRLALPRDTGMRVDTGGEDHEDLRLEFREVWWAESFGLPSVAETIAWARVQAMEQASHLLFPIGRRIGPAYAAARAPAREVRQALSYQTPTSGGDTSRAGAERSKASSTVTLGAPDALGTTHQSADSMLTRSPRVLLHGALGLYGVVQYVWKAAQWLLVTPLVLLLLLIMGLLRVLALIPPLQSSVVASISRVLEYIMLHWIAEAQVYTRDYARSAAIRERFEREVSTFLRDECCDRLVVIGHSMGTVIAYEGLTTVLDHAEFRDTEKPITFICLAQALRRLWLMTADDPGRLHGILPDGVRWLHFWARYDPVAAGPISARSLPRRESLSGDNPSHHNDALRGRLDRCENVDVVNTDGVFSDHTTYWLNLEQVVGPIALELVAGHAALEQHVRAHLATPDELLLRRWRVAWRASATLLAGIAAGIGVLVWANQHPDFGATLTTFLGGIRWGALVSAVCPACSAIPIPTLPPHPTMEQLEHYATSYGAGALVYLLSHYLSVGSVAVAGVALLATGVSMGMFERLLAEPSPFQFSATSTEGSDEGRMGAIVVLSALGVAMVFVASVLFSSYVHQSVTYTALPKSQFITAYVWTLGLAQLVFSLTYVVTVIVIVQRRQWAWLVSVILGVFLVGTGDTFFRMALLVIAVTGCLLTVHGSAPQRVSERRWWRRLALGLVALMAANAAIGTMLFRFDIVRTPLLGAGVGVEYLLPLLIYGLWLWSHRTQPAPQPAALGVIRRSSTQRILLGLTPAYVILASLLVFPLNLGSHYRYARLPSLSGFITSTAAGALTLRSAEVAALTLLSAIMFALSFTDAWRPGQRRWLVGVPLLLVSLSTALYALLQLGVTAYFAEWGVPLSFILATPALIYGLWAREPNKTLSG